MQHLEKILCRTKHITRKKIERGINLREALILSQSWRLKPPTKEIRFERAVYQQTEIIENTE